MSRLLLTLLLVIAASTARAQMQDHRIHEILNIDEKKAFDLKESTFASKQHSFSATAHVKEFQFDQKSLTKDFNAQAYGGTKTSWLKDLKFGTNNAITKGKYEIPNATKEAPVKTVAVKEASGADKVSSVREYAGTRPYLKHGPTDHFVQAKGETTDPSSNGWRGESMKQMTIEDVRKLLNTNK